MIYMLCFGSKIDPRVLLREGALVDVHDQLHEFCNSTNICKFVKAESPEKAIQYVIEEEGADAPPTGRIACYELSDRHLFSASRRVLYDVSECLSDGTAEEEG